MINENKKIKVLFRHQFMEMGGVEKVILSIINNLDIEKFDITVCLTINQGELRNEFPKHVKKIYIQDGREDFSKNPFIQKIQLLIRRIKLKIIEKNPKFVDQNILKQKFDIEIAPSYNSFSAVLNSSNKDSIKVGWFHSEINVPKLQPAVPKILASFSKFDHMIYCSHKIKDIMHYHYPNLNYPGESVIINAIPIEEIKKKADENIDHFPEGPVFISIGRLHTRKGYHKLIEVHKKLLDENLNHNIVIIGDGEEMENLTRQIKDNGVEKTFFLYGNKMNPYPYVKKANFFILPSESEAWPLVIAEALILQKPIIATDTGDISLMIKDKETGYLINYNTSEMYEAMKKFLTEPELIKNIQNNLTTIEEQFDNQKIFDDVENLILKLTRS